MIISFEQLEAARWLPYLKEGGKVVVSTQMIDPMPVITGSMDYPQDLIAKMRAAGADVDGVDALQLAEQAGSAKAVNIVLMGRVSRYFDFPLDAWYQALEESVPSKFIELNRKAFALGREEQDAAQA